MATTEDSLDYQLAKSNKPEYMKIRGELLEGYTKAVEKARIQCDQELDRAKAYRDRGDMDAWNQYVQDGCSAMYAYIQTRDDLRAECDIAQDEAREKYERIREEEWARFEQACKEVISYCSLVRKGQ